MSEKPTPDNNEDCELQPQLETVEAEVLEPDERELVQRVEGNRKVQRFIQRKLFKGPMPPPEDLAHYDEIVPGSGERILVMAETEQKSRIEHNKREQDIKRDYLREEMKIKSRGQVFALAVTILFFILSLTLILKDQFGLGAVMMGVTLSAIVAIFITGRGHASAESEQDDE